jgi:hypothetical protein
MRRGTNGVCQIIFALCSLVLGSMLKAQTTSFHNAPASAKDLKPLADIDGLDSARQSYERYLKTFESLGTAAPETEGVETSSEVAPAPRPPFTDYRFEKPGQIHKITLKDLPAPF